jgi:hypothetical protein
VHQLRGFAACWGEIGLTPVEIVQIKIPVLNQSPRRRPAYDRRAEEIHFQCPMLPVLKILEVLRYRLEGVAARTDDPDNYLRHAATGPQAAYTLPQLSIK